MPKARLTALKIENMKPPKTGQQDVFDQGYPGFGIRLSYAGAKTFFYHFKLGGKSARMSLGNFISKRTGGEPRLGGQLTLAEARAIYQTHRSAVDEGKDPRLQRPSGSKKFSVLVEQWLEMDQKKKRTYAEARRVVDKHLLPAWADRDVRDLTGQDVLDITDEFAKRGALTMSRRVHALIHRFFQWCVGRMVLTANPATGREKHGDEAKRDRVLSDAEIKAVWELASKHPYPFGPAIQLLMLTGQRRGKIASMRWSDIGDFWSDIDDIVWTIRREAREKGTPEKLILPQLALDVLDTCPRVEGQDLTFSTNGKTPISGWSKIKKLFDEQLNFDEPWVWHDLRRTAGTRMNEIGIEPHIVEALLGHKLPGVAGFYNRAQNDEPKRVALERWADKIQEIVEGPKGGNVIPIRGAL
jgi:integrase